MTSVKRQILRVDLEDFENNQVYAEYDNFKIASESDKYRLVSLGTYNPASTAGRHRYRDCCIVVYYVAAH